MYISPQSESAQDIASKSGMSHVPVMLCEVLQALKLHDGSVVVDATFGGGGYTKAILEAAKDVHVIAFDRDRAAIERAGPLKSKFKEGLQLIESPFSFMAEYVTGLVDGVVFDLGVSSYQFDEGARGFSFRFNAPLDMRMGQFEADTPTAADLVNTLSEEALADVIYYYGEERLARRVARVIVEARREARIETTFALKSLIGKVVKARPQDKIDPATRTFQALRIAVNDELRQLCEGLAAAEKILKPGGRLVVVSFHSLEDRLVKRFFDLRTGKLDVVSRYAPQVAHVEPLFVLEKRKHTEPSDAEMQVNARSRSAKMRVGVRTAADAQHLSEKDFERMGLVSLGGGV